MILDSPEQLATYWDTLGVPRFAAAIPDARGKGEFFDLMRTVGLPIQPWWLFRFGTIPTRSGRVWHFGHLGDTWLLGWRESTGDCFVLDEQGLEYHANASFLAFEQCLALFDQGYRRTQAECSGDSGDDWDKGDAIIGLMNSEMRAVDAGAFEHEDSLWPLLLVDIDG